MLSRTNLTRLLLIFSSAYLCFSLAACGWQLRGHDNINPLTSSTLAKLENLNVVSENRNNSFFRAFQMTMQRQGIQLDKASDFRVEFNNESLRRQPLTYNRSGIPAQYQLSLSLEYFATNKDQVIVEERTIVSRRNYDFDADLIIAKDREEQELLEEMRYELSNRIISSIRQKL